MNLDKLNLQELSKEEMQSMNGGYSWEELKKDVEELWEDTKDFFRGFGKGWRAATR